MAGLVTRCLAVLACATVEDIAQAINRNRSSVSRELRALRAIGIVRVIGEIRRRGRPALVYGLTS